MPATTKRGVDGRRLCICICIVSLHSRVDYYAEAWDVSKDGVQCDRKKIKCSSGVAFGENNH